MKNKYLRKKKSGSGKKERKEERKKKELAVLKGTGTYDEEKREKYKNHVDNECEEREIPATAES